MSPGRFDFSHLTVAERVELAEELWDSVAESHDALPLTEAQAEELDRRVAEYREDRSPGAPWLDVLKKIEESSS